MNRLHRWIAVLMICVSVTAGSVRSAVAAEHGHGDDHGTEEVKKEVPGMVPSQDLALWSLVTFVLMMAILGKFVWPPLAAGLSERERRIRQDIADAEATRLKSETLVAEREAKLATVQDEVREMLAEARRQADHAKAEIISAAQKEAEASRQRAIADIERSRDQALSELFDFISSNVVNATERVIGRSLGPNDHERLVNEALSELNVRRN